MTVNVRAAAAAVAHGRVDYAVRPSKLRRCPNCLRRMSVCVCTVCLRSVRRMVDGSAGAVRRQPHDINPLPVAAADWAPRLRRSAAPGRG